MLMVTFNLGDGAIYSHTLFLILGWKKLRWRYLSTNYDEETIVHV
jgi:hypothetical protein